MQHEKRIQGRSTRSTSIAGALVGALLLADPALAQTTTRASVGAGGVEGNGQSLSQDNSADGRFVTFTSVATNLVSGDTNGWADVFVRDVQNGATERASVSTGGAQGNQHSGDLRPSISPDGRLVTFASSASNLVANDTNSMGDVFVRDRLTGTTERISVSSAGAQANGGSKDGLDFSADGRFVAFVSGASNLVPGDTNGLFDVFVRDRTGGTTERVSVSSAGAQGTHTSGGEYVRLSADGRFVAFGSYASNLAPGGAGGVHHVYVRDRLTATTQRASVNSLGAPADADTGFNGISMSADGRYVAFDSIATNFGPGIGPGNVLVRDLVFGTIQVVSVDSTGTQAVGSSYGPALSSDGRYVAFVSHATNVVPGDTNTSSDVFVHDRVNGTNERVSLAASGAQANWDSGLNGLALSADGRYVAFAIGASNLVSGDGNGAYDIFRRDRGLLYPGAFCTAGTTTNGCVASISAAGVPSASSGSGFTLAVSSVEGQKQALFFYGLDNSGFTPTSWGAGTSFLCIKSPSQRTLVQSTGGTPNACDGVLALDWNAYIASNPAALGQPFGAGQHVFAQAWFRDPPAPKTTNLSNAFEFVVGP